MIGRGSPIETVLGDNAKGHKSKKRTAIVEGLKLRTVEDLLLHHPRRFLKTGELTRVDDLELGQLISVVGEIVKSDSNTYRERRTGAIAYRHDTLVRTDGPALRISFFAKRLHIAEWYVKRLPIGAKGIFTGQVGRFGNEWQLTNPSMVMFSDDAAQTGELGTISPKELPPLYPIYPLTRGVSSWDIYRAVRFALSVVDDMPEVIPAQLREHYRLPDVDTALRLIHGPADFDEVAAARRRFRFAEALVTQLVLARRREAHRRLGAAARPGRTGGLVDAFEQRLPFTLTQGQLDVRGEIFDDLAQPVPMNRLLQGEVGSGKTVVALDAMLRVIDSGAQAALLAPTEVLAQQHHRALSHLLGDLGRGGMLGASSEATTLTLLTGSMPQSAKRQALLEIASGEAGIVVGTHALLQDRVSFADLGLVVVDEQHRFGVEQRAALTDKAGTPPHVLVMTATPIPRSVAMTVFGDLEVSTLTELPAGRGTTQTNVVPLAEQPLWVDRVWQRVREEVAAGHQAYVVCPRISGDVSEVGSHDAPEIDADGELVEPDSVGGLTAVEELTPLLAEGALSETRVAALHGRMSGEEKDRIMRAFSSGDLDVLVSTTVIEVGVDVPNATTMVVMDADRFGISQLHQLRGRVGRGGHPGLCLLVTRLESDRPARDRLDAVARTTDGFALSRVDLEQRHEGDVLGAAQSGFRTGLHSLRVLRDEATILEAREGAETLLAADPDLSTHAELLAAIAELERSGASDFMEKS